MQALRAVEEATTQKIIGVQEQLELLKKACNAARFYSTPYVPLVCILVCDVLCFVFFRRDWCYVFVVHVLWFLIWRGVLQCVAVCCSVLPCSVLQSVAVAFWSSVVCCSVLPCVTVQCDAECCSGILIWRGVLQCVTVQCDAKCCSGILIWRALYCRSSTLWFFHSMVVVQVSRGGVYFCVCVCVCVCVYIYICAEWKNLHSMVVVQVSEVGVHFCVCLSRCLYLNSVVVLVCARGPVCLRAVRACLCGFRGYWGLFYVFCVLNLFVVQSREGTPYRVAWSHRMPCLHRLFSTKDPHN